MNDRELLELAAKAAGINLDLTLRPDGNPLGCSERGLAIDTVPGWWNPLTNSGDALDLAVKLGLLVYVMRDAGFTGIRLPGEHIGGKYDEVEVYHGADPYAATRRAITRAAAEIGRSKE